MDVTEQAYELLFRHLSRHITLNDAERALCRTAFQWKRLRKKDFLLQAGELCRFEHFVTRGCLRAYVVDQEGKEQILQFALDDEWIGDLSSFLLEQPAAYFIEALESSDVLIITQPALEQLYQDIPAFERLFRILRQKGFIALQQRVLTNLNQTPEERYVGFTTRYPNLEQRVPQEQVAAYLGMSPEFLSRIRRQLTGR